MALITVSGAPGCRTEEVARIAAQRLRFELVTESRLNKMAQEEFGVETPIPGHASKHVAASFLARLGTHSHIVAVCLGAELLFKHFPGLLRIQIIAPESRRV